MSLLPISFAMPWLLGLLTVLPVLWWLLRLTPPSPKKIVFPALSLIRDLVMPQQTPARTPWWILVLRLVIAAVLIFAFSGPTLNPEAILPQSGRLLIVVDNDWASARAWDARQTFLHELVQEAERAGREIVILPTAPAADGDPLHMIGPLSAKAAYGAVESLRPQPWPAQLKTALSLIQAADHPHFSDTVWLSGGLGDIDARLFYDTLIQSGSVDVRNDPSSPIYLLTPPEAEGDHQVITVKRALTDSAATIAVVAFDREGHSLASMPALFAEGVPDAVVQLNMPLDIRNQITRLEIAGSSSAGTTVLLDSRWRKRPVGLVGDKALLAEHSLLNGMFYIDRALQPFADLHVDTLQHLLGQKMSVLILTDATTLSNTEKTDLETWVRQGGVLLRFAGERLAVADGASDKLLPVILRNGDRAMGGSLSWAVPQKLRAFGATSPFRGLVIPDDVTVARQVLAEPTPDLAAHGWASLVDGTPLVTGRELGQGLLILFHVPARSDWSNLPLSGLFVDMLRRVIDLSQGTGGDIQLASLPPLRVLDGFGTMQTPGPAATAITPGNLTHNEAGPLHPPGLYGSDAFNSAFNLGSAIGHPEPFSGIPTKDYVQTSTAVDMQPYLLLLAFGLFMIDLFTGFILRGLVPLSLAGMIIGLVLAATLCETAGAAPMTDKSNPVDLTAGTYLAYIQTGNRDVDHVSRQGLIGLSRALQQRTSIEPVDVKAVDPEHEDLAFYALVYWPVVSGALPLSPSGVDHVNSYLHHGGMILLDSQNGEPMSPSVLQNMLSGIDIPPLVRLPEEHVLKHSFYLLSDFTGRYDNHDFWLEPEDLSSYDGVATVLYGVDGYAAAWAVDDAGQVLYPCVPGGEVQREYAYRFGINLVMYALTGNYKSDQMHAQGLLKRLGK